MRDPSKCVVACYVPSKPAVPSKHTCRCTRAHTHTQTRIQARAHTRLIHSSDICTFAKGLLFVAWQHPCLHGHVILCHHATMLSIQGPDGCSDSFLAERSGLEPSIVPLNVGHVSLLSMCACLFVGGVRQEKISMQIDRMHTIRSRIIGASTPIRCWVGPSDPASHGFLQCAGLLASCIIGSK